MEKQTTRLEPTGNSLWYPAKGDGLIGAFCDEPHGGVTGGHRSERAILSDPEAVLSADQIGRGPFNGDFRAQMLASPAMRILEQSDRGQEDDDGHRVYACECQHSAQGK
jgi:hypothetical protein